LEKRVLVIGDSCTDVYVYGSCTRLCPDAPVPVFIPEFRKENKGMAGNVYENLLSLHIGAELLTNEGSVEKTRYVEQNTNHMIVRVDSGEEKIKRIENLQAVDFDKYDAIAISDYDKGFLSHEDIEFISTQHSLVFMDTKKILGAWAQNVSFIKINEIEYERTRYTLVNKIWADQSLIITRGSEGCSYRGEIFPVSKVEIKDLSGAGDTFLAAMVAKYLETINIRTSLRFANKCATVVVQQKGVNTINDV